MALNTYALRLVQARQHWVSFSDSARKKSSLRGQSKFTWEAWVKVGAGSTSPNQRVYVESQTSDASLIRFACAPTRDGARSIVRFEFCRKDGGNPTSYTYVLPQDWDDRWHHVAFSADCGRNRRYSLYYDGVKVQSGTLSGAGTEKDENNNETDLKVGGDIDKSGNEDKYQPAAISIGSYRAKSGTRIYWDGKIDNIRIQKSFKDQSTFGTEMFDQLDTYATATDLIEEWRFNEGPPRTSTGSTTTTGWMAGNFLSTHAKNSWATVTSNSVNFRSSPSLSGSIMFTLSSGDTVQILGDSATADGYTWYKVARSSSASSATTTLGTKDPVNNKATLKKGESPSAELWIGPGCQIDYDALIHDYDIPYIGNGLVDDIAPLPPTNLVTSELTPDSFRVSWTPAIDNIYVQRYELDVATDTAFQKLLTDYNNRSVGRSTEFPVIGLNADSTYYWRVRAVDSANNTSQWVSTTALPTYTTTDETRINYSYNPSIETTMDYWVPVAPTGALPDVTREKYGATLAAPAGVTGLGEYYLKVTNSRTQSGADSGVAHIVPWEQGKQVAVSFYVKGTGALRVLAFPRKDFNPISDTSSATAPVILNWGTTSGPSCDLNDGEWKRVNFTLTPNPANTTMDVLEIRILNSGAGGATYEFNIDGMLIEQGAISTLPYFDGDFASDTYWVSPLPSTSSATVRGWVTQRKTNGVADTTSFGYSHASPSAKGIVVASSPVGISTNAALDRLEPGVPVVVSAAALVTTPKGFIAAWTPPVVNFADIDGYELRVGLTANLNSATAIRVKGYENLRVGKVLSRAVVGLTPKTTYFYQVRAYDAFGNFSAWSDTVRIATREEPDEEPPAEVELLPPYDVSWDSFVATWLPTHDNVGVVGYKLSVAVGTPNNYLLHDLVLPADTLSYKVTDLLPQQDYFYSVKAYDAAGNITQGLIQDDATLDFVEGSFQPIRTLARLTSDGGDMIQNFLIGDFVDRGTTTETPGFPQLRHRPYNQTDRQGYFQVNLRGAQGLIEGADLYLHREPVIQSSLIASMLVNGTKAAPNQSVAAPSYTATTVTITPLTPPSSSDRYAPIYNGTLLHTQSSAPAADADNPIVIENWTGKTLSVDLSPLMTVGARTYGFKVETNNDVAFRMVANTEDTLHPQVMLRTNIADQQALGLINQSLASDTETIRNVFPNPTLDTLLNRAVIRNPSFAGASVDGWKLEIEGTGSLAEFGAVDQGSDVDGGAGYITVNAFNPLTTSIAAVNSTLFPVSDTYTYTLSANVATSSTKLVPKIAIRWFDSISGTTLLGTNIDTVSGLTRANVWERRQLLNVTPPAGATHAQVLVFAEPLNEQTGTIKFDAFVINVNSNGEVINVIREGIGTNRPTIGFDASVPPFTSVPGTEERSFKAAFLHQGDAIRFHAPVNQNEQWISPYLDQAVVNLMENPSFESSFGVNDAEKYSSFGGAEISRSSLYTGFGGYSLRVDVKNTDPDQNNGVTLRSATIGVPIQSQFVASFKCLRGTGTGALKAKLQAKFEGNELLQGGEEITLTPINGQWTSYHTGNVGSWDGVNNVWGTEVLEYLVLSVYGTGDSVQSIYLDDVQIEPAYADNSEPRLYCDGNQHASDCFWAGVPNQSISYRGAFLGHLRMRTNKADAPFTIHLELTYDNGHKVLSPVVSAPALTGMLTNALSPWVPLVTWPVAPVPQFLSTHDLQSADLVVTATRAKGTETEEVIAYFDAITTQFGGQGYSVIDGSSPTSEWVGDPYASPSERHTAHIINRTYYAGDANNTSEILTYFKPGGWTEFDNSGEGTSLYRRNQKYVETVLPRIIRWNELSNPSFERDVTGWAKSTSIALQYLPDSGAHAGNAVAVLRVTATDPNAYVSPLDYVPALPGQRWSAAAHLRAVQIGQGRISPVGGALHLVFYDAEGNRILSNDPDLTATFDLVVGGGWTRVDATGVAPNGTARVSLEIIPQDGSMQSGDIFHLDSVLLYRGAAGRTYRDGGYTDDGVYWEGRSHASPSLFSFRERTSYDIKTVPYDNDGLTDYTKVAISSITTKSQPARYAEFHFNDAIKQEFDSYFELLIPYRGDDERTASVIAEFRRADQTGWSDAVVNYNRSDRTVKVTQGGLNAHTAYLVRVSVTAAPGLLRGASSHIYTINTTFPPLFDTNKSDNTVSYGGMVLSGDNSKYFWVSSHDSFSLPGRRIQSEVLPRRDGAVELQSYWDKKVITLEGGVWGETRQLLDANLKQLRAALSEKKQPLRIDTLAQSGAYYIATCSGLKINEQAGQNLTNLTWSATFECSDPHLYAATESTTTAIISARGSQLSVEDLLTSDEVFAVNNAGTVSALPRVTISANDSTNEYAVVVYNDTTGDRFLPKTTLKSGEYLVIDSTIKSCKKQGGISVDYLGSFPELAPGTNNMRVSINSLNQQRHNLLENPSADDAFTRDGVDNIYPYYAISSNTKNAIGGVTVSQSRTQTYGGSLYAALVYADGSAKEQGVVFRTPTGLSNSQNWTADTKRSFSAVAAVRTDVTNRAWTLGKCFIRIWYAGGEAILTDGAFVTAPIGSNWSIITFPKVESELGKGLIDYVELVISTPTTASTAYAQKPVTFYVDDCKLAEGYVGNIDVNLNFTIDVVHRERYI